MKKRETFFSNLYIKKAGITLIILSITGIVTVPRLQAEKIQFQWPMIRGAYPRLLGITSTFGESRKDHFHTGLDISGIHLPVHPVQSGTILFSRFEDDNPFQPTHGAGNYMIIDHGNGYWSGYFHLEAPGDSRKGAITLDDVVGISGNSGHSFGAHLHFFITDKYGEEYLNPLQLLPPVVDENPPVIGQLAIYTGETTNTRVSHSRKENIRLTRRYPILLSIIDPGMELSTRRGIYRVKWRLNGGDWQELDFGSIKSSPRGWQLAGKSLFQETYQHDLYNLGEMNFVNGTNLLEVTAQDFNNNITSAQFDINVQREF